MLGCPAGFGRRRGCQPEPFDIQAHYTKAEYRVPVRDGKRLFTVVPRAQDLQQDLPGADDPHALWLRPLWRGHTRRAAFAVGRVPEERLCLRLPGRARPLACPRASGSKCGLRFPVKRSNADGTKSSDAYDSIEWMLKHLTGQTGASVSGGVRTLASMPLQL